MTNYFQMLAETMSKLGILQYLFPFILLTAVCFAMLKKSKLLGSSDVINGVISLVIGFMIIFGLPAATTNMFSSSISMFLMQASIFLLVFIVGFVIASIFYPNIMDWLPKVFTTRSMLMVSITIAIVLFITSGLVGIFTAGLYGPPAPGAPSLPPDLIIFIVGIFLFITFIIIASAVVRATKK